MTMTILAPEPRPETSSDLQGWAELRLCADLFARTQAERIAVGNMLLHTDPDLFGDHKARLEAAEHAALLMLRRCYRRVVPKELQEWQKANKGLGEDSVARILGHLGDPYVAYPYRWTATPGPAHVCGRVCRADRHLEAGEPYIRMVSQLWQYCGHGDASLKKVKGMSAEDAFRLGNPQLKMLVHLQAEWCIRQTGRYRDVYDRAREAAESKVHQVACVRCGPSGKPALPGSSWSKGHQHAHGLRIVGKEILRDMWIARYNTFNT
jgi:hypothetical protein